MIKEWRELVRDGRFRAAGAAVLVLLLATLATGWHASRTLRAQHDAASALTRDHWLTQGAKNPHSAAHYGVYAFKPKPALAMLDEGVDSYSGVAVYLEAHRQNEFSFRPAADATALQRFSALTAAGVLQGLIPLLIILFGFRAFTGEREQGTMRQLLSAGLPPRRLMLGKLLGAASGLLALLAPAAVIGSLALVLAVGGDGLWSRSGVLAAAYLAYFLLWLGLTLGVSARAGSSRSALLFLLGFWIAGAVFAPRALTEIVRHRYPTPSTAAFQQALRDEIEHGPDGTSSSAARTAELRERLLRQYGVDSVSHLPVNFSGIALQESEVWSDRVFDRHFGALWDRYERQEGLRTAAGIVTPTLAVRSLSMALAGTDVRHHRRFTEAAEQYRRHLVRLMNDDLAVHGVGQTGPYLADSELWASVPPFDYRGPSLGAVLRYRGWILAVLAIWAMGTLGWAVRQAGRWHPERAR